MHKPQLLTSAHWKYGRSSGTALWVLHKYYILYMPTYFSLFRERDRNWLSSWGEGHGYSLNKVDIRLYDRSRCGEVKEGNRQWMRVSRGGWGWQGARWLRRIWEGYEVLGMRLMRDSREVQEEYGDRRKISRRVIGVRLRVLYWLIRGGVDIWERNLSRLFILGWELGAFRALFSSVCFSESSFWFIWEGESIAFVGIWFEEIFWCFASS